MFSRPKVPKLDVRRHDNGKDVEVSHDATTFKVVHAVVRVSLELVRTGAAQSALGRVGQRIVETTEDKDLIVKKAQYQQHRDRCVRRFVDSLLSEFPVIVLKDIPEDAASVLRTWGADAKKFSPRESGELHLNKKVIDHMAQIQDEGKNGPPPTKYYAFKLYAIMAIGKQMARFFRNYLTQKGQEADVESGRAWERLLLGGRLEFWTRPDTQAVDKTHPGMPYLLEDDSEKAGARTVPYKTAVRFVSGKFALPLLPPTKKYAETRASLLGKGQVNTSEFWHEKKPEPKREPHAAVHPFFPFYPPLVPGTVAAPVPMMPMMPVYGGYYPPHLAAAVAQGVPASNSSAPPPPYPANGAGYAVPSPYGPVAPHPWSFGTAS
ncbi:hypothetical protein VTK73DRAFT_6895 [Phialemonium thermophilum]|uniref:Uncharacterized protein n=1 Tax=Phialemonium thermophilum TaxID=223376 RepID=A0ABR3WHW4_9PEZI